MQAQRRRPPLDVFARDESENLRLLLDFRQNGHTQEEYLQLPENLQSIIAARYTYPVTHGWSISFLSTLHGILNSDFLFHRIDFNRLASGTEEAISMQENIVISKSVLTILEGRHDRIGILENLNNIRATHPEHFRSLAQFLTEKLRAYNEDNERHHRANPYHNPLITNPNEMLEFYRADPELFANFIDRRIFNYNRGWL